MTIINKSIYKLLMFKQLCLFKCIITIIIKIEIFIFNSNTVIIVVILIQNMFNNKKRVI